MSPAALKKLRKQNDISRIELAACSGLTSGYIAQIEEEEIPVMDRDLERLERVIKQILKQRREAEEDETDEVS